MPARERKSLRIARRASPVPTTELLGMTSKTGTAGDQPIILAPTECSTLERTIRRLMNTQRP